MKVMKLKNIEGCLEGIHVKDVLFDKEISKSYIDYLSIAGKLIYLESSEKPFFKVIVRGSYSIKGSQGNYSARLLLPDNWTDEDMKNLLKFLEDYPD
jgi:hypothetical protein